MKAWIASLLVTALLIAGCGGGGDDPTPVASTGTTSGQLSKAELIEQGDAICAQVFAVTKTLNPEGSVKEAIRFARLHGEMIKRLLALGVPRETEYNYAEYTNGAHVLARAEEEVLETAKRDDPAALRLAESGSLSARSMFQSLAGTYGFIECAQG